MSKSLWYTRPASEWTEALPLGNGRLGAMVYGGVGREELQLNESTLWSGGPYQPINPEALPNLDAVREHIFAGQYRQAHEIAQQHLLAKPHAQMSYQPAGNLFLDFRHEAVPGSYRRSLDLASGVTRSEYALLGSGLDPHAPRYTRTAFASAAEDVLVLRLETSVAATLDFEIWIDSPQPGAILSGDSGMLSYRGSNFGQNGVAGQLRFGFDTRLKLEGGSVERRGDRLVVRNADAATVLVDIATSFVRFDDVSGDVEDRLANATRLSLPLIMPRSMPGTSKHIQRSSIVSISIWERQARTFRQINGSSSSAVARTRRSPRFMCIMRDT